MRTIRVLRNIGSNYARMVVSILVGIVLTPIMVHALGDTGYGIWIAVFALTGYFGLFDQGIRPSLVRYVSMHEAAKDRAALSRTLSGAMVLYAAVGVVTLLATLLVASQFDRFLKIDPQHVETARAVVLLSGISLALGFPLGVFGAALSGLQRYDIANGIGVAVLVVRIVLFVVVLRLGGGLVELAWASLGLNLMGHLLSFGFMRRLIPDVKLSPRLAERESLVRIGSYSGYAFVGAIAASLAFQTDAIVITAFLGPAMVTPFALAASLVAQARTLVQGAAWVLSPTASELDTLGERGKLHAMLTLATKYAVLLCWPVLFALIVFAENVLTTWVGPKYGESAHLLHILAIPTMLALPQTSAASILFGVSKHRGVVAIAIVSALLNLALSLWWVGPFGLEGVAMGTAVPLGLVSGVFALWWSSHTLGLPLGAYLWNGTLRPGLVSTSFLAPALLIQHVLHPVGWIPLLASCAASWLVFAAVAWRFGVDETERERWSTSVPRALGLRPAAARSGG